MDSSSRHLQAAGYSIASNISVQILVRGFTFFLRAIILKYLKSTALLGIIYIRLALLYTTLQFLSREPFRRACIGEVARSNKKQIVNTIWLGFVISLSLTYPLALLWKLNAPPEDDLSGTNVQDYFNAVFITCLAVIVEMAGESCFIYAQAKAIPKHNPKVEALSVSIKSLIACAFVIECSNYDPDQPTYILTKVALSQLVGSLISVIYSYSRLCADYHVSTQDFLPSIRSGLDQASLRLSLSFVHQTFLKQLLTEGERYIMTFLDVITLSDQGIYDVINNLGSLAARLVFKPIEDSGYTLFSQIVSRTETLDIRRFYRVQQYLISMIKAMLLLGLAVFTFGYNFVPLIVLYGGEKLNNQLAFQLMKWQLFYTPLLAVNGVTECFTFATMDSKGIRNYNYQLISYSLVFLATIYSTKAYLASASFMFANCFIMTMRIFFSWKIIGNYFDKHGYRLTLQNALPSLTTMISMSGSFIFLSISQYYLLDMTQPISVVFGLFLGAYCAVFMSHVVWSQEEELVNFVTQLFKKHK